ncbi:MAG: hypothetical protein V7L20_14430 [Nostoc sp.]
MTLRLLRLRPSTSVVEGRSRKACGIGTLRAQPLVELGAVEVVKGLKVKSIIE